MKILTNEIYTSKTVIAIDAIFEEIRIVTIGTILSIA
jgi:hypothetical protein